MSYIEPALPVLLLVGLAGLVRAWWSSSKHQPWLLTVSISGIALLSMNGVAWLLSRPLEMWYSEDPVPRGTADAIVVLSGAVNLPLPNAPYAFPAQDTYIRLQRAAWLFKKWKPLPILICAGADPWYATAMRHVMESEGVPPDLIWVESRSHNTRENALYGSEVLREHGVSRIALVIEASSMPRAAASFRKLGITVLPVPARYINLNRELSDWFPNWHAIANNGDTVHELVGLIWYWVHGWI